MKIKVGDMVVPRFRLGKVIKITKQEVIIRWVDNDGKERQSYLTEQQAQLRNKGLDQHADDSLVIIKVDDLQEENI